MVLIVGQTTRFDTDWVPFEIAYAVDTFEIPIIAAYPGYDYIQAPEQLAAVWPAAFAERIRCGAAHVIHVPFRREALKDSIMQFSHDKYPLGAGLGAYSPDAYSGFGISMRQGALKVEQIVNVSSSDLTLDNWLTLGRRINQIFTDDPDVAGIVVTHGTNTLEETGYFLNLTVKSDRPVVTLGFMRPATAIRALSALVAGATAISAAGSKVSRIDHVAVNVSDLKRSSEFYQRVFSAEVSQIPRPSNEVQLDLGRSGYLVLRRADRPGSIDHLALRLEQFDVRSVRKQLNASGIEAVGEPNTAGTPGFHVVDPDGLKVQLV